MCGIFGVSNDNEASNLTYLGLYALQHRGQEGAGIISSNGEKLFRSRSQSLVADAFNERELEYLQGHAAIGHVRYSTTGSNILRNVQPFVAGVHGEELSVAHNGNITNFEQIKKELSDKGAIFQTGMDTEAILHLLAMQDKDLPLIKRIANTLKHFEGAFSLLFLNKSELIAARDPWGIRPLALGKAKVSSNSNDAWFLASETCAFDLIDAEYVRDVEPGEVISINKEGHIKSEFLEHKKQSSRCVFEHVYFSRPDSKVFTENVYDNRKALGKYLAKETQSLKPDFVMPVPDSGILATIGYSEESGVPFELGMIRNHYVGRTFIEPKQAIRGFGVKVKLNPVPNLLKNKHIAVIDDSIVRGTTSKKIVSMLRKAGAKRISLLISSPPFVSPCYFGIDTPNEKDLIASQKTLEELKEYIQVDDLHYLSLDGLYKAVNSDQNNKTICDACFTKNYPVEVLPTFSS